MISLAEWTFLLALVLPPAAVIIALIAIVAAAVFGRRAPDKPQPKLRAA